MNKILLFSASLPPLSKLMAYSNQQQKEQTKVVLQTEVKQEQTKVVLQTDLSKTSKTTLSTAEKSLTETTKLGKTTEFSKTAETKEVALIKATSTGFEAEARAQLETLHTLDADAQKKILANLAEGESTSAYEGDTTHNDKTCSAGDVEVTVKDNSPQLVDDKATTDQGVPVVIDVTANDANLDNLDLASL